jgi:hypothetical protein
MQEEEKSYNGNARVHMKTIEGLGFTDTLETRQRLGTKTILNWIGDQATVAKMQALPQFLIHEKNLSFVRST